MAKLSPAAQKFVLHWGEMGTRWGINRTVAQIHALLYISAQPLHAEEITEILGVARSNVSTSLHELQGWGIVRIVHVLGDRRDHFETIKDVWEMFRLILNERKRREIDPTLMLLKDCAAEAQKSGASESQERERLDELLEFFETMTSVYDQFHALSPATLRKFARAGDKVKKVMKLIS